MTRIYFIRHGETDWNSAGRYQGWTNIPLNDSGREQARLLAERFQDVPLDAIYTSPLDRAYDTAKAVAEKKDMKAIPDEHFKEINFGQWEGGTVQELGDKYGREFLDFFKEPHKYPMPGEGSFQNAENRVLTGINTILQKHENENVMIVSHGGLLRIAIIALMGMDGSFYRKTWLNNTSVSIIDFKKNSKILLTLNDFSHIKNLV